MTNGNVFKPPKTMKHLSKSESQGFFVIPVLVILLPFMSFCGYLPSQWLCSMKAGCIWSIWIIQKTFQINFETLSISVAPNTKIENLGRSRALVKQGFPFSWPNHSSYSWFFVCHCSLSYSAVYQLPNSTKSRDLEMKLSRRLKWLQRYIYVKSENRGGGGMTLHFRPRPWLTRRSIHFRF